MTRAAYLARRAVQTAALRLYPLFEFFGLHVLPDHFYYPAADSRGLTDATFTAVSECPGIAWNDDVQQGYARDVFPRYVRERAFEPNEGLNVLDAAILHAMIRHHRPRKVVEVGSGATSHMIADALARNAAGGVAYEYVAIDPYPRPLVTGGVPGLTRLRRERVQDVELSEFAGCDLLFIDSSHVAGIGTDVNYEQLEILPRLKPGAVVHFHDILLPGEYWKDWVVGRRYFWTEQYLLRAFLTFNPAFEILWASRYMQLRGEQHVRRVFPGYDSAHRMTSFWIRRRPQ